MLHISLNIRYCVRLKPSVACNVFEWKFMEMTDSFSNNVRLYKVINDANQGNHRNDCFRKLKVNKEDKNKYISEFDVLEAIRNISEHIRCICNYD